MGMSLLSVLIVGIHALLAWIVIEVFVNLAHPLSRRSYILWHYVVVVVSFAAMFWVYYRFFPPMASPFAVTMVGMLFVFSFEWVVFRYLYSGERWFLNWVDWIFPIFLAISTMYLMGVWVP